MALPPVANGAHSSWFGDVQDVDEAASFNCGGNDSIGKGGASSDRESFRVDISSVPIGATITSVAVTVRDAASPADAGGTYQTFARIDAADVDSGANLEATAKLFDECSEPKVQAIDVPDVVRSDDTTLEVGVVKTPPDGSAIRVGTIAATVTYEPPTGGAPCILLSGTAVAVSGPASTPSTRGMAGPLPRIAMRNCGTSTSGYEVRGTDASGPGATWELTNASSGGPVDSLCELGVDLFRADLTVWLSDGSGAGTVLTVAATTLLDRESPTSPSLKPLLLAPSADREISPQVELPCEGSSGLDQPMSMDVVITAVPAP